MSNDTQPAAQTEMEDALEVLACDYQQRPRGAPSFVDLEPAIRRVTRHADALEVEFDPAAAEQVEALVAAERLCCATIGWELTRHPAPHLRIREIGRASCRERV